MDAHESAKQLAINYIDYAARTVAEVRRRLERAEYDDQVIESVIEDLQRAELLNDAKFSEDWIDSRTRTKKLGKIRLASELRRKGISQEDADMALQELDPEREVAAALEISTKRLPQSEIDNLTAPGERSAAKRRLAGFLQRRGYKWEIIEQVFAKLFSNED
jgi:regulatory protein